MSNDYVIHSDEEPLRLERQARLYDTAAELRHLDLDGCTRVLDAGCGSGAMSRAIARAAPQAEVIGVDRDARYIDFARRQAAAEGLTNLHFVVGDVTDLPLPDGHVDRVWTKHLLQWVAARDRAIAELVRVTAPEGRVVCVNFDQFFTTHVPQDPGLQPQMDAWMAAASAAFGFDKDLGRKLPVLMQRAGLTGIEVTVTADAAFSGFGGDPERVWNWEIQVQASSAFTEQVFGGAEAARDYAERLMQRLRDPDVYVACPLYVVCGRKPG